MITELLAGLLSAHDLPDPPPADPVPTLVRWLEEARASGKYEDPNAMTLATATREGAPSARMVLCKGIETGTSASPPALTFFTNYESRKAQELEVNPRAAAVFHWPHAKRQARIEGEIRRTSAAESDAYFATRALLSRVGATVSRQSHPIASRAELVRAAMSVAAGAATGNLPRPAWWGGYRLVMRTVELWSGREGRLHQRVEWRREGDAQAWTWRLLSP